MVPEVQAAHGGESMTLRQEYASKALAGMCASREFINEQLVIEAKCKENVYVNMARWAFGFADAMIAFEAAEFGYAAGAESGKEKAEDAFLQGD
jgi:hypothetical protein